jgi:hypothetical protein
MRGNDSGLFANGPSQRISYARAGGTPPAICTVVRGRWGAARFEDARAACIPAPAAAQIVPMNKTLWLYGVLVFAGGLVGGALTSGVCRSRTVAAAPVAANNDTKTPKPAPRQIVSASEFVVLDAAGKPRAKIDVNEDGQAGFAMYDRDNHPRAQIVVDNQGAPSVRLYDTSNRLRLSLEVSPDGIPAVRLMDSGSHARELLGIDAQGEAGIEFYAQDGTVLRELP